MQKNAIVPAIKLTATATAILIAATTPGLMPIPTAGAVGVEEVEAEVDPGAVPNEEAEEEAAATFVAMV